MSEGFAVLLVSEWGQAAAGRLLDALAAGGMALAHPLDGDGRLLRDDGVHRPVGLGELRDQLAHLETDICSQFWLSPDTDVVFWWRRRGLGGALLIFYLDGLLIDEATLALATLCKACGALGQADTVLACDVESHSQADDWLEAFESGWPAVVPMPCVLVLGDAVTETVAPKLRPSPAERERDGLVLLGRPGDRLWRSLLEVGG